MLIFAMVTKQKNNCFSNEWFMYWSNVHKVCTSLQSNGYRVLLLGQKTKFKPK